MLVTSLLHRINTVNTMTITLATSNAIRMHYRHCYYYPTTEVPGGEGGEEGEGGEDGGEDG
jgi:hypothetical protein